MHVLRATRDPAARGREQAASRAASRMLGPEPPSPLRAGAPLGGPAPLRTLLGEDGVALRQPDRAYFEHRLGRDVGAVRLHAGERGGQLARRLGAMAFALGLEAGPLAVQPLLETLGGSWDVTRYEFVSAPDGGPHEGCGIALTFTPGP